MKTVLVTGGSRGIGAACVRAFSRDGWVCAFCARHDGPGAEAVARETGALFIPCDVGDAGQVAAMADTVRRKLHRLDALVLNAGISVTGLAQDMSEEDFDLLYRVNLKGPFLCARAFLPMMISQKTGSIVTVSSMWGQVGGSCESAYSAFKAGLIGWTKALAKECGPSGIRVNCLSPGYIDTDMNAAYGEDVRRQMAEDTPLGRLGTPEDCASAALFLCSGGASFITGQLLPVNGGLVT